MPTSSIGLPATLFLAAQLAALSGVAAAEEDGEPIEQIIVAAQSIEDTIPFELSKYGNRLQVLSSAEIELGGFDDLGQTLQMEIPGLYLAPRSGAFDYMNCSLQGSRCGDPAGTGKTRIESVTRW